MQPDRDTPTSPPSELPQKPHVGFPAMSPTRPQNIPPTEPPITDPALESEPLTDNGQRFSIAKGFLSFVGFVVSVVLLATLINLFVFQSYYVDGTSMTPTLQPNERLIINKLPRTWAGLTNSHYVPKRGEIIVFNSARVSPENGQREQLIKRVIGLPGERVVVKDGKVTIYNQANPNGFNPDESLKLTLSATDGDVDTVIPENHIFVCGDNRAPGGSYDSRSDIGPVSTDKLVGELVMRLVPLNKAKLY